MSSKNELYPVFLKLELLNVIIIGGGAVAEEKLHFLLKSSPKARVRLVAKQVSDKIYKLAQENNIEIIISEFHQTHLIGSSIVICATDNSDLNKLVRKLCRIQNILVNVADKPELCDFYMGGIVSKGNVKVAISTNGKSPTLAKRLREFLENVIPEQVDDLALNLNQIRKGVSGSFQQKVKELNRITKQLID